MRRSILNASAWIWNHLILLWGNLKHKRDEIKHVNVFLAIPSQPSDLPLYMFRGVEIQTERLKMQPLSPQKLFTNHTRRERSLSSLEKRVIIIFRISLSIVFSKNPARTYGGSARNNIIKINWRRVIFHPMVFCFVWAKQKWNLQETVTSSPFLHPSRLRHSLARSLADPASLAINGELASRLREI